MAGRIPQHFIDDLIGRTDIVELIGSRVPLKKAGREWKACCPFHDETCNRNSKVLAWVTHAAKARRTCPSFASAAVVRSAPLSPISSMGSPNCIASHVDGIRENASGSPVAVRNSPAGP